MIKGFYIINDFISEQEEKEIIELIKKSTTKKTTGRNSIQRFGSDIPYKNYIVSDDVPCFLDKLSQKLCDENLLLVKPDSITINEYHTGQKITPHIDSKESGDIISVLSLLSSATMRFQQIRMNEISVKLPPRSLIQLKGDIRENWTHSIDPVKATRYSIIFRCSKV